MISLFIHVDYEKRNTFFPFSSFEIIDIPEIENNNMKVYQIKLLYLGKNEKKFMNKDYKN